MGCRRHRKTSNDSGTRCSDLSGNEKADAVAKKGMKSKGSCTLITEGELKLSWPRKRNAEIEVAAGMRKGRVPNRQMTGRCG